MRSASIAAITLTAKCNKEKAGACFSLEASPLLQKGESPAEPPAISGRKGFPRVDKPYETLFPSSHALHLREDTMAENIEDITISYAENGQTLVEELDKEVLTKGAWTTILFRYRQYESKLDGFGPERYTIRRYKKINGEFRPQSKFNISSQKQAQQIVDTLNRWMAES
jgi:hypothetical protein